MHHYIILPGMCLISSRNGVVGTPKLSDVVKQRYFKFSVGNFFSKTSSSTHSLHYKDSNL